MKVWRAPKIAPKLFKPPSPLIEATLSHNQDLRRVVVDYCNFPFNQGHALMISGSWGSGKTFLIKKIMEEHFPSRIASDPNRPLYISLFSVRGPSEIADQLYQQLHPVLSGRGMRLAAAVLKSAIKGAIRIDLTQVHSDMTLGSQLPDLKLSDISGGPRSRIIIFDDFERAVMNPGEILGFINPLIEYDDCKVLILANESELKRDPASYKTYLLWKEKVVGVTIDVNAEVGEALDAFSKEIRTTWVKNFYEKHRQDLIDIFDSAGVCNMRSLKVFLWKFEEFCNVLSEDQKTHEDGMRELLKLLCAMTLEFRSGNLIADDLPFDGMATASKLRLAPQDTAAMRRNAASARYEKSVDLSSKIISGRTILNFIERSFFDASAIQAELHGHPAFAKPEEVVSWRMLWLSGELEPVDVEPVIVRFERDLESRRFSRREEVLHVTGLCIWLALIKQSGWAERDIVAFMGNYIDDLVAKRDAGPDDLSGPNRLSPLDNGALNLGFRNTDDPRFALVRAYLDQELNKWRQRAFPSIATSLLDLMQSDSSAFLKAVCQSAEGTGPYAAIPILKELDVEDFVRVFAKLKVVDQKNTLLALHTRYDNLPHFESALADEGEWLQRIFKELIAFSETLSPVPQDNLKTQINGYLTKPLEHMDRVAKWRECLSSSRTGAASPPDTIDVPTPSCQPSSSPQPCSSGSINET